MRRERKNFIIEIFNIENWWDERKNGIKYLLINKWNNGLKISQRICKSVFIVAVWKYPE